MVFVLVWIGYDGFFLEVFYGNGWGVRLGVGGDGDDFVISLYIIIFWFLNLFK